MWGVVALVFVSALAITGSALGGAEGAALAQAPSLKLKLVGSVSQPTHIAHAPRNPRLVYVVEQPGTIRVVRRGKVLPRPFLDLSGRVRQVSGSGMLSVAFHPRYPRNRRFYVFYVNRDGNIQVDGLRSRRGRPARAARQSRKPVIKVPHPGEGNHFGGQLALGAKGGLLYLSTGDGGSGGGPGDPFANAQNKLTLLGKLLRIRPLSGGGHRSPQTNPFVGEEGRNEIYSMGLRNPWRFSIDDRAGELWLGDVGHGEREEVNRVTLADANGANFGWNCFEGSERYGQRPESCESVDPETFTPPVFEYPIKDVADCAVMGGHVVRGPAAPPELRGRYVYGDLCSGRIHSLDAKSPSAATDMDTGLMVPGGFGLTSFGKGRGGMVYLAERSGGRIFKIVSR